MTVSVIKRPIITEKSLDLARLGGYTFEVDKRATKKDIKSAVEKYFNVEVTRVRTLKIAGKRRFAGKRRRKRVNLSSWKKAIVWLKSGQKIDIFEG